MIDGRAKLDYLIFSLVMACYYCIDGTREPIIKAPADGLAGNTRVTDVLQNAPIRAADTASPAEPRQRRHLGRTRERQDAKRFRAELIEHIDGNPSVTQMALIERVVQLQLHLAVMDRRFAGEHTMAEHASKQYLAWAGALARLLKQLDVTPTATRPLTLSEKLAQPSTSRFSMAPAAAPATAPPAHSAPPSGATRAAA